MSSCQDFFVKTKAKTSTSKTEIKTKTLGLKTKTKTLFFVLEAPRDQDFGLEDYITAIFFIKQDNARDIRLQWRQSLDFLR